MSFYGDALFFIVLIISLIPAIILGFKEKSIKHYGLFLTALMIFLIYKDVPKEFLYLGLFYCLEWALVKGYFTLKKKCDKNKTIYKLCIVLSLLPLVLSKITGLVHLNIFSFLGISYVTFKIIQIIIETYDGLIEEMTFMDFSYFVLFFPALSSGPIDRSRRFLEDVEHPLPKEKYLDLVGLGLQKIVLGAFYKFVLSAILFKVVGMLSHHYSIGSLWLYGIVYGVYMFFDFAGYSAMAIGTSYMLGIKTPENFNLPFISIDIKDFWNRWHISLSHWFRDFVFSRFIMDSMKKKRFKKRANTAFVGFVINMMVMGVWHGLTPDYILYGLYHGLLLGFTEKYQKNAKFYKNNKNRTWYKLCSWFITMNLVMFGFLIFSGQFLKAIQIIFFK